ncbi:YraN family protein [Pelagibius marinus]|uniref:YraN family protein n=1 Tax=Pelagibius marinus TaxID=2762760 RepID=UPI0018733E14|nr:YraN family protein [Pelagibius marinus]
MTQAARRRALVRGRRAERIAAWWLRLQGYRILERGFRVPVGEIDLIARRGGTLAVIEVKRRARLAEAGEAIRRRQQRRVVHAAQAYLQRHPELSRLQLRFDALLLVPRRLPHHIKDAWKADSFLL